MERSRNADKLDLLFDKVIKDAMYVTAKKIAEKMENAYQLVVAEFYADYPTDAPRPKYYNRTYSLREASNMAGGNYTKGISRIYGGKLKGYSGYEIKLSVNSENVPDGIKSKHRADYDWVFDRALLYGIHGFTAEENETWANEEGSKWIYKNTVPTQMDYSPRRAFLKWFDKFKKSSEPQKMFVNSLSNSLKKNMKR